MSTGHQNSENTVDRVPGFLFSSRWIWFPPPNSLASECCPPPFGSEGDTLACGKRGEGEGANSDEGTDTLVL
jgi:hypothetical protein